MQHIAAAWDDRGTEVRAIEIVEIELRKRLPFLLVDAGTRILSRFKTIQSFIDVDGMARFGHFSVGDYVYPGLDLLSDHVGNRFA